MHGSQGSGVGNTGQPLAATFDIAKGKEERGGGGSAETQQCSKDTYVCCMIYRRARGPVLNRE